LEYVNFMLQKIGWKIKYVIITKIIWMTLTIKFSVFSLIKYLTP
jgi:hypothetical protein